MQIVSSLAESLLPKYAVRHNLWSTTFSKEIIPYLVFFLRVSPKWTEEYIQTSNHLYRVLCWCHRYRKTTHRRFTLPIDKIRANLRLRCSAQLEWEKGGSYAFHGSTPNGLL